MSTPDTILQPPLGPSSSDQGFDRVWAVLKASERFMTEAEIKVALGEEADALWRAFVDDGRFATSIVTEDRDDAEPRYQRFSEAASMISSLLEAEGHAQTRGDICARLSISPNDQVWSNIVKRLRFSVPLEVEAGANCPVRYSLSQHGAVERDAAPSAEEAPTSSQIAVALGPGDVVAERYEVTGTLGRGGFGVVYRGRQLNTETPVAIKVLRPGQQHDPEVIEHMAVRFEREMQLLAQLNHPNIVKLYDSGRLPGGGLYTVLEFIDGVPLDRLLRRGGALSAREALRLMRQVANVLHHAHRQGVIHRDLKPANIMVTDPGPYCNAMVLDFGIASLQTPAEDERLTAVGHFLGTPHYMAPEQIRGEATPQIDIYAWGLVFIECFDGRPVYAHEQVGWIMAQQVSTDPVPIPDAVRASAMGPIIARAVDKSPDARTPDAETLLAALEELDPRTLDAPPPRPRSLSRVLIPSAAILAAALLVWIAWTFLV